MATTIAPVRAGARRMDRGMALCLGACAFYTAMLVVPVLVLLIVPLVVAVLVGGRGAARREQVPPASGTFLAVATAFVVLAAISVLANGPDTEGVRALATLLPLPIVAAVLAGGTVHRSPHLLTSMWLGVTLGAAIAALLAVLQVVVVGMPRAVGVHVNSIVFGDLAVLMGAMSLGLHSVVDLRRFGTTGRRLADRFGNRSARVVAVAAAVLGLLASLLSGARGGWVAIPMLAALLVIHHRGALSTMQMRRAIAVTAGVALLAVVIADGMPIVRAADAFDDVRRYVGAAPSESAAGTTLGARIEAWRSAVGAFVDRPLVGIGWGNLQDHFRADVAGGARHPRIAEFTHAHNQGIGALANGGLLGLGALAALLAVPARSFARAWASSDDTDRTVGLTGLCVVVAYLVFGFSEAVFESVVPLSFFAVSVAALTSQLDASGGRGERRGSGQPWRLRVVARGAGTTALPTLEDRCGPCAEEAHRDGLRAVAGDDHDARPRRGVRRPRADPDGGRAVAR